MREMFYLKYVALEITQSEPLDDWIEVLKPEGISVEYAPQNEDALWITDEESRARQLQREGKPVLGLLHEGGQEQRFDGIKYLATDLSEIDAEYLDKVYRRQKGIPWDILETARCTLRETIPQDADAFYALYEEPSITEHTEGLPPERDAFLAWLSDYAKHVYELFGYGLWTVCDKASGEIIGRAGLTVREGFDAPELAFMIAKPWQGRGLAFEVCSAILQYAKKLEIPEVIAFSETSNAASIGLLNKLGFNLEQELFLDERLCQQYKVLL